MNRLMERVMAQDERMDREALEGVYGPNNVWSQEELEERFVVLGVMAPFVVVKGRVTGRATAHAEVRVKGMGIGEGEKGTVEFQGSPKLYFGYVPMAGKGKEVGE